MNVDVICRKPSSPKFPGANHQQLGLVPGTHHVVIPDPLGGEVGLCLEFLLELFRICIAYVVGIIIDEEDTLAIIIVVVWEVTLVNDKKKSRENTSLRGSRRSDILWLALAGFNLNDLLPF